MANKSKAKELEFYRERAEKAQQEHQQMIELLELLPDDLEFKSACKISYQANLSVTIEVATLEEIPSLLAKLPPMDMICVRDGSTSFIPLASIDVDTECRTWYSVFPTIFRCQYHRLGGDNLEAEWYHELPNGKRLAIKAEVKESWKYISWGGKKSMRQGQVHIIGESFTHWFKHGKLIKWSKGSPEHFGDYTIFFNPDDGSTFEAVTERDIHAHFTKRS